MNENFLIRGYTENDLNEVMNIFNRFVNGFAVYPEFELSEEKFTRLLENVKIFLVIQYGGSIVGYGYISTFKPLPNFSHTGVLSYFILPEFTGKGLGTKLFNKLISEGREKGITNYLAHISSKNQQSINFHKKHDFKEAGRFKNVGIKFGHSIDMIWMQKEFPNESDQ